MSIDEIAEQAELAPKDIKVMINKGKKLIRAKIESATRLLRPTYRAMTQQDETVVLLSDRDRGKFLDCMENPPEPNDKLLRAAKSHESRTTESSSTGQPTPPSWG